MKNIQIIRREKIENFLIDEIWVTDIFKQLQKKKGNLLNLIIKKLTEQPLFFYELSHPGEKNHLTSFIRFIGRRTYENPHIQDLYYFHELVHAVAFDFSKDDFLLWQEELSENELLASLYSEVFIYLVEPELLDKTFDDLWVKNFITPEHDKIKPCNLYVDLNLENDRRWLNQYYENKINFLSLNLKNWPYQIQKIIMERRHLRTVFEITKNFSSSELKIISYNQKRVNWLPKWKPYYKEINKNLLQLKKNCKDDEEFAIVQFLSFIEKNSNSEGIVFPSVIGAK